MTRLSKLLLASFGAIAAILPPSAANAADMVRQYAPESGICANTAVLGRISSRFGYQVSHVPNLPNVGIVDFYNIRETRYLPEMEGQPIARRYCAATARLSDGRDHPVWYLIEYGMGFASLGDNVEFCVGGFDRWHVYNGYCRVLQ